MFPEGGMYDTKFESHIKKKKFFKIFKSPDSQESAIKKIANFPLLFKRDCHFAKKNMS